MTVLIGVVPLVIGFAAGFCTFKRSNRWCPHCGGRLRCQNCNQTAELKTTTTES
jgi:NADH pyrophosphatase NudC (nudix superfamily)